mgnify:CR=1 FL=1
MTLVNRRSTPSASGLCILWLILAGSQAAPAAAVGVTPRIPTISRRADAAVHREWSHHTDRCGSGRRIHLCARLPDGTAQCTGAEPVRAARQWESRQLLVLDPVSGITTATRVAAGDEYACALLGDGTARCWGLGESGQRGDGSFTTFTSDLTPVAVGGLTGAVSLATGYGHRCALLADATMRCWGENREGQLGNGTTASPGTPQAVAVSGITGATAFTDRGLSHLRGAGERHACGAGDGMATAAAGQRDLSRARRTPVTVSGITTAAVVSGGAAHVRGADRRHGAMLGRKRPRAAGQRDDGGVDHAGAGGWTCRRGQPSAPDGDTPAPSSGTAPSAAGGRTSTGNSATGPPRAGRHRCRSAESPAPSPSRPGGGTTAARSWGTAR